jgi:hypothetical protein
VRRRSIVWDADTILRGDRAYGINDPGGRDPTETRIARLVAAEGQ